MAALAALSPENRAARLILTVIAAIGVVTLHRAGASRVAARAEIWSLLRLHGGTTGASVQRAVAAVRKLVAAPHDELKAVAFAALAAADVYATRVRDDFQKAFARLEAPRAIGVVEVAILGGNALHALLRSKDRASIKCAPYGWAREGAD